MDFHKIKTYVCINPLISNFVFVMINLNIQTDLYSNKPSIYNNQLKKSRYNLVGFRSQGSTITYCYLMRHTKSAGTTHLHREFPDIQVNITSSLISEASSPLLFRAMPTRYKHHTILMEKVLQAQTKSFLAKS